jgi:hypothetical protein
MAEQLEEREHARQQMAKRLEEGEHVRQQMAKQLEEGEHARQQMAEQLEEGERARQQMAGQLEASTARVQALESAAAEQAHLAGALTQARQQLQSTDRERETLADDLATQTARIHLLESEITGTRAAIEHLPMVFRAVAAARTMPDALTAVANGLTGLFARVALFRAKSDRLEGVSQSGFDFAGDISNVVVPMTIESIMSAAVSSDSVRVLTALDLAGNNALPFGGAATAAIVLPLSVEGKTVAAVYADDGGASAEGPSVEERGTYASLVRDYAMAHIERLVNAERTLGELNAYAGMLLEEVERLYAADAAGGHDEPTLRGRLLENLQTARRIYAQRVEHEAPPAAAFLEERIVSTARAARATPFGRDVLEVAFNDGAKSDPGSLRAAQAS